MSLAPPTRPLPSSPSVRGSDLPLRSNSTRTSPPRHTDKENSHTKAQRSSEDDFDQTKKDFERSKALDRVSGHVNGTGKPAAGGLAQRGSFYGGSAGLHIQINDTPEAPAEWGSNFWVTIMDPLVRPTAYSG